VLIFGQQLPSKRQHAKKFNNFSVNDIHIVACHADVPWCNAMSKNDASIPVYPPIARAAHVSGAVVALVTIDARSETSDVAPLSGPVLLSSYLVKALKSWKFVSSDTNQKLCQGLVIVDFRLDTQAKSYTSPSVPNIVRFNVEAMSLIISDPAPYTGRKHFRWFRGRHRNT
jgi:hypothetical protein